MRLGLLVVWGGYLELHELIIINQYTSFFDPPPTLLLLDPPMIITSLIHPQLLCDFISKRI